MVARGPELLLVAVEDVLVLEKREGPEVAEDDVGKVENSGVKCVAEWEVAEQNLFVNVMAAGVVAAETWVA